KFRLANAAVAPGYRDRRPGEASNDGFERQLHCQVEMRRDERLAAFNDFTPIRLERVGGVIESNREERLQKKICGPVEGQLQLWVVNDPSAFQKTTAEDTIPALVELLPIPYHVAAIVGFVRHHNDYPVALDAIQPVGHSAAET